MAVDFREALEQPLCFLVIRAYADSDMCAQVIAQMAPTAIANTGWRIYLLFCVMLFLSIPFAFFLLPEVSLHLPPRRSLRGLLTRDASKKTNGKTLEEIDFIFAKGEAKTSDTGCVEMNVTSSEDKQGVERHESICISPPVAV